MARSFGEMVKGLFGRSSSVEKASKASSAYHGAFGWGNTDAFFTEDTVEKSIYDAYFFYRNSPIVRGCVDIKARSIAHVPVVVARSGDTDMTPINDAAVDAFIASPNPNQSFADFVFDLVGHLEVWGNTYVEMVGDPKQEAYALKPSGMRLIHASGGVRRYEYSVNGRTIQFTSDEIVHGLHADLGNDFIGLSPVKSALDQLLTMYRAQVFNDGYFKRGGRIALAFLMNENLSDEDFKRTKETLQKDYSGSHNAHKNIILSGVKEVQELALNPKDVEFAEMTRSIRENFMGLIGVPPVMLGIFEYANYANAEVQKRIFWQESLSPLMVKIEGLLTRLVNRLFGRSDVVVRFDRSKVPALQDDETVRVSNAMRELEAGAITINEYRKTKKLPLFIPEGDVPMVTAGKIPLKDAVSDLSETRTTDFTAEEMPEIRNGLDTGRYGLFAQQMTLAIDRLMSRGDIEGANSLRRSMAEILEIKMPGKLKTENSGAKENAQ